MKYKYSYKLNIGNIYIVEEDGYIAQISMKSIDNDYQIKETDNIRNTIKEIEEYLNGIRKVFTIKYKLVGTPFQVKVWNELLKINYGETKSYSDIAVSLGNDSLKRAVGNASNKNPLFIVVPCHRVIGKNGDMVGYALGINVKKELLNIEKNKK